MPDPSDLPASDPPDFLDPFNTPAPTADVSAVPPRRPLTDIPPDALDDQQRVDCELPCRQCGYNLRTLSAHGHCPECGAEVYWSLIGDLLRFADPAWLTTLAKGMLWVLLSIILSFLLGFVVSFVGAVTNNLLPAQFLMLAASLVALGTATYGYWCLTTPEPQPDDAPFVTAGVRAWARWLLMISAALGLVASFFQMWINFGYRYDAPLTTATSIMWTASSAVDILNSLTSLAGLFCLAVVLRRLALRAPHKGIAGQTRFVFWAWAVSLGLGAVALVVFWAIESYAPGGLSSSSNASDVGWMVLGCSYMIWLLALGIWTLVLLIRYHLLFKKHAGYARFRVPAHPAASLG